VSRSRSVSDPASLLDDFLAALLAGDSVRARHLVDEAIAGGMTVGEVYLQVLGPALEDIGERWEHGEVNVAYEHQATMITQSIVGSLGPRMRVRPTSGRLAVVACTQGELHALGAQMVGDFLEAEGWEVLPLGASVPAGALAELVSEERPDAVVLSTASPGSLPGVEETIAALRAVEPRPYIVVGGRLWRLVPAERALALGADACITEPDELARELAARFPPVDDG
jgi:MerR family transcriptional regulator, light-induced transcriptional regulator